MMCHEDEYEVRTWKALESFLGKQQVFHVDQSKMIHLAESPVDLRERTQLSNSVLFRRLISPMLSIAPARPTKPTYIVEPTAPPDIPGTAL